MARTATPARHDFDIDPNFKPATPTRVLKATRGNATVITKLYGPVSPERLAIEERNVVHRAEQLSTRQPRQNDELVDEPLNFTRSAERRRRNVIAE